jgi:farnesyl diphosphate synthase
VALDPLLAEALPAIAREVDGLFDAMLPAKGRLAEAMRYAAIGGGKRLRPLLLTATAGMHGVDRSQALRAAIAIESLHGD